MTTAKCSQCGGSAIADTYDEARQLINHAVGLSRGIKCGDNYNLVQEIKDTVTTKTDKGTYQKVKGKSTKNIKVDEVTPKTDTSKSETTKPSSEKPKEKSKPKKSSSDNSYQ